MKLEKCTLLSQTWVDNNAVVFDIHKAEAVLFSRRRCHRRQINETIKAAPGVEKKLNHEATGWLGVWLDSQLTLNEHHKKTMSKACRAEARIRSLRGKFGSTSQNVRKIQVAAVQSVTPYGPEKWRDERGTTSRTADLQKISQLTIPLNNWNVQKHSSWPTSKRGRA
jgi:hypothetical protein